jgi:methyl-accepting chemotaxis protein
MSEEKVSPVVLNSIPAAAMRHEIRIKDQQTDMDRSKHKQDELAKYKTELLDKVEEHMEVLECMDRKAADLATFKQELLNKVDEHMHDVENHQIKTTELAKFKKEMLESVQKFSSGKAN